MPTLLPTVKGWITGTDWILSSLEYRYDGNPMPVRMIAQPMQILEGKIDEVVEIKMVAPGFHEIGPPVPRQVTISNGYSGSSTLIMGDSALEFEASSVACGGGSRIMVQSGMTTFRVEGRMVT